MLLFERETMMRLALVAPLLFLTGCNVDNDPANEQVTVRYDRERIHKAGNAAKEVATGVEGS